MGKLQLLPGIKLPVIIPRFPVYIELLIHSYENQHFFLMVRTLSFFMLI